MCKYMIDSKSNDDENSVLKSADLGKFYRYINSKLSSKSGIAPLKTEDGTYAFTALEKANLLNKYFGSVCTIDDNLTPAISAPDNVQILDGINFMTNQTFKILNKQKCKFSSGPDGFPPIMFKRLARVLRGQ